MRKLLFTCRTNNYSNLDEEYMEYLYLHQCNTYKKQVEKRYIFIANCKKYFMSFSQGGQMLICGGAPPIIGNTQMTYQKYRFLQSLYKK